VHEDRPGQAVQLAAAAAALRDSAGLPPLRGARAETYLAPARHLGEPAVARLWAQGQALSSDAAIALALDPHQPSAAADASPALTLLKTGQEPDASPSPLTRREYQIAGLVASGRSPSPHEPRSRPGSPAAGQMLGSSIRPGHHRNPRQTPAVAADRQAGELPGSGLRDRMCGTRTMVR
jgi:hypothetical protein